MTKADDQRLAALARKNAAKETQAKKKKERRRFDDTLRDETEEDMDAQKFFSEMKRREF